MNLALIGYGKMGKEAERIALERGHSISKTFDSKSAPLSGEEARRIDVGIHFSKAETVRKDIEHWSGLGKDLVVGTTGWGKDLDIVAALVKKAGTGLIYASNYSIGVNLFFRLVQELGDLINAFPEYDLSIHETHHKEKADSPSGTALTLAEILLKRVERKKGKLVGAPEGKIKPELLHVVSTRLGAVVGTHTVTADSGADTIELTHRAKNRSGFALGAVLAAEWIHGRKGIFTMDDILEEMLTNRSRSQKSDL